MHSVEVKHKEYENLRQYIVSKSFIHTFEVLFEYDLAMEGDIYRLKLYLDKYKIVILQAIQRKDRDRLCDNMKLITDRKILISLLRILIYKYKIDQEKENLQQERRDN